VVFDSDGLPAELSLRVETTIKAELGLDIRVIGRTHADLDRIVADDPYPRAEPTQHHVVFLSGEPRTEGLAGLGQAVAGDEAFVVVDGAIHLFLPDGIGRTRLSQALIERRLGVVGTARNWRTVTELHRLSNPTLA
ncbi:MAG: DUF1697 domain-containing protein, partial [Candidatus Limnocylindrales bacterium]